MGDGMGPSVGGQRPRDNNFTVEGVDNNNKVVTGALITVPNDAVENFTLLENQFNAEFGHSSGGQFNTTIKSGYEQLSRIALRVFQKPQHERRRRNFRTARTHLESAIGQQPLRCDLRWTDYQEQIVLLYRF